MELAVNTFEELSSRVLFEIYKLRTAIFVVEQQCCYHEVDVYDLTALHVLGYREKQLIAYTRICPPGSSSPEPSIGRVAVETHFRGMGHGRAIFTEALRAARQKFLQQPIKIQAQGYLEEFYRDFGFKTVSEPYQDVGIWHVDMVVENKSYSS